MIPSRSLQHKYDSLTFKVYDVVPQEYDLKYKKTKIEGAFYLGLTKYNTQGNLKMNACALYFMRNISLLYQHLPSIY